MRIFTKRVLKYMLRGARESIIIGTPDFSQNNQYTDMANIGKDFNIAIKEVVNESRNTNQAKADKDRQTPIYK